MEKNLSLNQLQQVFGKPNEKSDEYFQDYLSKYFDEKTLLDDFQSAQNLFYPIMKKYFSDIKIYAKNDQYDIHSQEITKQKKKLVIEPFDWFEVIEKNCQELEINPQQQEHKNQQPSKDIELQKIGQQQDKYATHINDICQPLSKYQLQSIQKNGRFISCDQGDQPKVWQISENFYASYEFMKKHFKQFDYSKLKEVWCSEESKIRINKKTWKNFGLSFCYWNMQDGLQTIFVDMPFQLLNCLIGTPVTIKTKITLANYFLKYLKPYFEKINLSQMNVFNEQDFLDRIKSFDFIAVMFDKIKNLKWHQIHFILLRNLKIYLLIECVKEFFNQNNDLDVKYKNQIKLVEDLFYCVLIFDYLEDRIKMCENNDISQVQIIVQDCQFFIKYYKLDAFERYLNIFSNKINKFSQNQLWIADYDPSFKFERNKYFWKIITHYQTIKNIFIENTINKVLINILYGCLGFSVVFRKQNKESSHKTLYETFQQIKIKVKTNIQKRFNQDLEDLNDDGDGIFGDCCSRLPIATYIFNYFCVYFLHGIIFVNIILRMIGIFFMVLQLFLVILLYAFAIFTFLLSYLINILVYDEYNESNLNIPFAFPLFYIMIVNPILGICKIMFSFFKFFFYFLQLLALKIRTMAKSLKNCLAFILIKLFSQVPHRDSSYCYLIQNQDYQNYEIKQKNSYQQQSQNQIPENCKIIMEKISQKPIKLKYFSSEQIKLFIDLELDQKYMEFLLSELDKYTKQYQIETEAALAKAFNYLPFSEKQIVVNMQTNIKSFQQQMKQIIELKYANELEIQNDEDCTIVYEKDQLDGIYQQIQLIQRETIAIICQQNILYKKCFKNI
ncbi:transmembrane protein, putative (macronuclear) [Tetrahymena thermophila SB210]|uniref:Transmembrane protein, putative n=1 Tax=Tetrahymena thermophila (strain SB210) TaxID=312017 RepID=I7MH56_TETTS|nr:transmembrane protein, putative [Tetrahymena thermophila SB210]EAR86095.2 transmembrane protein, putative [Tetrahymena thermophila SB210]|eukprot:XP_976690.2 transmembrane protein, putative [Tetrahymena thermophila SB210]